MALPHLKRVATLILMSMSVTGAATGLKLQTGKPFPGVPLPSLENGSRRTIADWRGQRLMLHVFASW